MIQQKEKIGFVTLMIIIQEDSYILALCDRCNRVCRASKNATVYYVYKLSLKKNHNANAVVLEVGAADRADVFICGTSFYVPQYSTNMP